MTEQAKNIYLTIEGHRSIRKYKDQPVPEDVLQRILAAATRASSSGNMQAYSVIVTQEPELKRQLFKPHFEQSMVLEAPVLLTFCADFHRMRKWLELNQAPPNFDNFMSFMIGAIDAILASQNAALAAEAEGLGICYMGTTLASCLEIAKILRCPEHVVPVVGFSLGYASEDPAPRDRLPLSGLVHRETYRSPTEPEIEKVYEERETRGWARYNSVPELKKMIEESKVENLAQVYTKVKYTRESHIDYSRTVLECLSAQGFFNH